MTHIYTENLHVNLNKKSILFDLHLKIPKGKITSIIGKNGSGKSTLLKTLSRLILPLSGQIIIEGKNIGEFSQKNLAKKISFLAQSQEMVQTFKVRDIVALGRFAHQNMFYKESETDTQMIDWAMLVTHTAHLKDENIENLSGGQKQKVFLAMNLAQGSDILFLDEPTTYLDIQSQIELLQLVKQLNEQENKTIVMILHDINQACSYSHNVFVLKEGRIYDEGPVDKVINCKMFFDVFGVHANVYRSDNGKVIFYPESILAENYLDSNSIEHKMLVSCIREKIIHDVKIEENAEDNLKTYTVSLHDSFAFQFKAKTFKSCSRFLIQSSILLLKNNLFLKRLDKDELYRLIKTYIQKNMSLKIINEHFFQEVEESIRNIDVLKKLNKEYLNVSKYSSALSYVNEQKSKHNLFSSSVFFEQSVVNGHPVHPNSKTRLGFSDTDLLKYSPESRNTFSLLVCAIKKEFCYTYFLDAEGENKILEYLKIFDVKDQFTIRSLDIKDYQIIIMHPWQYENIFKPYYLKHFNENNFFVLNTTLSATPLISVRSLALQNLHNLPMPNIKLALSILLTGDKRVLTDRAIESGVEISKIIQQIELNLLQKTQHDVKLYVLKEFYGSSVHLKNLNLKEEYPDRVSDRFSFLLRENPENLIEDKSIIVLPCAALIESSPFSKSLLLEELIEEYQIQKEQSSGELKEVAISFFKEYVEVVLPGFFIYLTKYGISLEGHLQNTSIAFKHGRPVQVFYRDLSDIRIYKKRLEKNHIKLNLKYHNSAIFSDTLEELYSNVFYSFIQGHLLEIIIKLADIYGVNEEILLNVVRQKIMQTFLKLADDSNILANIIEDKYAIFMQENLKFKAVFKMRMQDEISTYHYQTTDNPLYMRV